jgi:galactose oxidase
MIEPTTADACTPKFRTLLRAGWTASASDELPDCPAGKVLDGDPATFWHSTYTPTGSPLPHSITIDMHATMDVSGLTYLPRQDGSPNGTIGRYEITTSSDGTTWSSAVATGTWNDDARERSSSFRPSRCASSG